MKPRQPQAFPLAQVRRKIQAALGASGLPGPIDAAGLIAASPGLIKSLPGWIGRFGWLESPGAFVLWCEPRRGGGESFPSQAVLDVPSGRYFVDAYDVRSRQWISRESVEGGPLVVGLPAEGGSVLLLIRLFAARGQ